MKRVGVTTMLGAGLFALAVLMATDVVLALRAPSFWMVPAMLAGWYCADLMSGVVHMYMDYRPCPSDIGLGRMFSFEGSRESPEYLALRDETFAKIGTFERVVYDFKNHHPRPDALGRRSIDIHVGPTLFFTTLPFAIVTTAAFLLLHAPGWLVAGTLAFLIGATLAQYFHGALHREDVPPIVRLMRRARLLMRPEDHIAHHETLMQDFSTINGWSNPPLNRLFRYLRAHGRLRDDGLVPR